MDSQTKTSGRPLLSSRPLHTYEFPLREVMIPKTCLSIVMYIGGTVNHNMVDGNVEIPLTEIPVREERDRLVVRWPDLVTRGIEILEDLAPNLLVHEGVTAVVLAPLEAATRYLVAEDGMSSSVGYARLYCSTAGNPLPPVYKGKGKGPHAVFPVYPGWNVMEALCVRGVEMSLLKLHRLTVTRSTLERSIVWKGSHWKHLPLSMESYRSVLQKAEWKATHQDDRPLMYKP